MQNQEIDNYFKIAKDSPNNTRIYDEFLDFKSNENLYSSTFNSTDFYNFYNNLINNDELLYNMEKYNYIGIFCLHPYFSKQWIDFKQNKYFYIKEICDYQNLILKSSLLVTDYSSIFFDFSYLSYFI